MEKISRDNLGRKEKEKRKDTFLFPYILQTIITFLAINWFRSIRLKRNSSFLIAFCANCRIVSD